MRSSAIAAWTRRLIVVLLVFHGWNTLADAANSGAIGHVFVAFFPWLIAIYLLLPDTLPFASRCVERAFVTLYLSSDSTPPLDYSLARRMVKRCEFSVAAREYLKILEYYPKEFDAYRELIQVGIACGDTDASKQTFDRAMKRLAAPQREALRAEFPDLAR